MSNAVLWLLAAMTVVTAVRADDASRPPMPSMSAKLNAAAYPTAAIKQGEQGRVLVEFSINKRGRIDAQLISHAEPVAIFDEAALAVLRDIKFTVPDNWNDTGGPAQRYRLSILFKLNPCPPESCTAPKPHTEADDFLIIGALRK